MRKRTEKHRGSRTHGRGKKAGRGAGKRGGRGNAGLHKHKYMTTVKYHPDHFGRPPIKRHYSLRIKKNVINLGKLQDNLSKLIKDGIAEKKGGKIELDLQKLEIGKLLGGGTIRSPIRIIVNEATERAREKIEAAGGTIILPDAEKNVQEKEDEVEEAE